ncbi:MAG: carbamoyltransferase HypF [Verrucomicrobia bacterium]|nr:carbamoyltransferase HypF [Verrucomicrobiota bacterium]
MQCGPDARQRSFFVGSSALPPQCVNTNPANGQCPRLKLAVRGVVQGVGFRPFVHRLATELGLTGWVNNSAQGVFIEVEGRRMALDQFLLRLETEKPPRSFIQSKEAIWLAAGGYPNFEIRASEPGGAKTALILPDLATCPACRREISDPTNRRHQYPFTNCTHCGPRFSIIEALPYDRANTTMRRFRMCPACQAEYDNPCDRRFHAQPNACPVCGPQLELWPGHPSNSWLRDPHEPPRRLAHGHDALLSAAHVIRCGQIVAVKGVGGFHLLVDARDGAAVRRLRERKQREEKPFALMFPSLESVKAVCEVSPLEERLLRSPEAPIVLLKRLAPPPPNPSSQERVRVVAHDEPSGLPIADSVAPGNPCLGVMLPSNPLHHLLLAELGFPVVATSGNLSDEPICTDEFEAIERLRGIADVLLVHDRPIVRPVDDSIVRVMVDREMIMRRARGYAPLPITFSSQPSTRDSQPILAVGAHLKNAVALAVDGQVFISQHIGDLATEPAHDAFCRVAADLPRLYDAKPAVIVADLHPDYRSTKFAQEQAVSAGRLRYVGVQHHVAHVLACVAENEVALPALGVAWDGTGYGPDSTIWGGEFFLVTNVAVTRAAYLRPFRLPGGDAAVKEPRRAALGLLYEMYGNEVFARKDLPTVSAFTDAELHSLLTMLERGVNAPFTSSMGRLFDAVASLTGLRQKMQFEGQAAMELEFALNGIQTDERYDMPFVSHHAALVLDWAPMIAAMGEDLQRHLPLGNIAAKFHNALAQAIVHVAQRIGCPRVALSGGCLQNRYLTERSVRRLRAAGFQPHWHQRVPPNDGGIALGQVFAAQRGLELRK